MGKKKTIRFTVPCVDFADYNPGHGTNTVREELRYIRKNYDVKAYSRRVGDGIEFTIIGHPVAVADLENLTGAH